MVQPFLPRDHGQSVDHVLDLEIFEAEAIDCELRKVGENARKGTCGNLLSHSDDVG